MINAFSSHVRSALLTLSLEHTCMCSTIVFCCCSYDSYVVPHFENCRVVGGLKRLENSTLYICYYCHFFVCFRSLFCRCYFCSPSHHIPFHNNNIKKCCVYWCIQKIIFTRVLFHINFICYLKIENL